MQILQGALAPGTSGLNLPPADEDDEDDGRKQNANERG